MATFLANEINATDRDVTDPTEQVLIMFPLRPSEKQDMFLVSARFVF